MLVEPASNQVVLFFFVWIKLPFLPQVSDSVEHSKLLLRVFVHVCNYKSQIHSSTVVLILHAAVNRASSAPTWEKRTPTGSGCHLRGEFTGGGGEDFGVGVDVGCGGGGAHERHIVERGEEDSAV